MNVQVELSKDGGKTWGIDRNRELRRPRRSPRARVRSGRPETHAARQRRRSLRDLRRREDLAVLHQPADHAVLPNLGRQREAVLQRLRRHAGQLVVLRPVALADAVGRSDQRLVHRQRRRRVPDAQRSGRSDRSSMRSRRTAAFAATTSRPGRRAAFVRRSHRGRPWLRRRRRRDAGAAAAGAPQGAAGARCAGCAGCAGCAQGAQGCGAVRRVRSRGAAVEDVGPAIAPTGIRPTSSARTRRRGCTGRRSTSIAPTIAAIPGRASARTCRAISIHTTIPIMGKVWPRDSVALNTSTTALSNVVSLDESPLLEGLIYAGTDDGLAAGDGGRRQELAQDRGLPRRAEVDVCLATSSRRRGTRTWSSSRSTTGSAATTSPTS